MTNYYKEARLYLFSGATGILAYSALSTLLPEQPPEVYLKGSFFAFLVGGIAFSLLEDIINKKN